MPAAKIYLLKSLTCGSVKHNSVTRIPYAHHYMLRSEWVTQASSSNVLDAQRQCALIAVLGKCSESLNSELSARLQRENMDEAMIISRVNWTVHRRWQSSDQTD